LEALVRDGYTTFVLHIHSQVHIWKELGELLDHGNDALHCFSVQFFNVVEHLCFSISYTDTTNSLVRGQHSSRTQSQVVRIEGRKGR
jgi:hypothetical protein